MFRHWMDPGVDPFEVRRRVGRCRIGLSVLDLTDVRLLADLAIDHADLVDDDLVLCQGLADEARKAGFEGILAPSAAMFGEVSLVVFGSAVSRIEVELDRGVRRPPPRMLGLAGSIRFLEAGVRTTMTRIALETVGRISGKWP